MFEDPGGKHVVVSSNFSPGNKFGVGNYRVEYTATNEMTGRQTGCQFTVDVTGEGGKRRADVEELGGLFICFCCVV